MGASRSGGDKASLLIVDDDLSTLSQLGMALSDEYAVETADCAARAWDLIRTRRPELMTLDLALDGEDPETGFSLLDKCLFLDPMMKIVLITGNDGRENALRAVDKGAADFLGKPVNLDELRVVLRRLHAIGELERANAQRSTYANGEHCCGALVAASDQMQAVFRTIEMIAPRDISVLILGESGTGKGLVAEEIHRLSPRASKPFVTIDCGAIPHSLLESELFGHEKGAFTGAHVARAGCLESADQGTVFLDEVAELPLALQVKLLRFLQTHEVQRIGSRRPVKLDVRVIVATNRNLDEDVKQGRFREDLYYRLSVMNLHLPPLREHQEDIPLLAKHFLDRFGKEFGRGKLSLTARARDALLHHTWPGNVRELEHGIQKAVIMSRGRLVDVADLGLGSTPAAAAFSLRSARDEADRQAITTALERSGGNISRAAKLLGISRPSLYELLVKHGISLEDFRANGSSAHRPVGE